MAVVPAEASLEVRPERAAQVLSQEVRRAEGV